MRSAQSFLDPVTDAECGECGFPMMMLWTEVSAPIATLSRMECTACDAQGTVETRPDESIAKQVGVFYHGAATDPTEQATIEGGEPE
jgi:hypothetical protein